MSGGLAPLAGTLVARIVSDDLFGDIPGRRLAIAESIATLAEKAGDAGHLQHLWILNRFRHEDLLDRYRHALRCRTPAGIELRGEAVTLYASDFANTQIVELPFRRTALDACPDESAALRYLANPNVGRNAAIAFGASCGAARTFVLDGDIHVPRRTWTQTAQLVAAHGPDCPVWLFTMRSWSLEQFASQFPEEDAGRAVMDACGNELVLNSWPPQVQLGDEGMLGLPRGADYFDERREYSNDPKVAYCTALRASGRTLLTPTYPVCHLEHRQELVLPDTLSAAAREDALLEHRLSIRETAKRELLDCWRPA